MHQTATETGFSLVEVVVAMLLLTVLALAVLPLMVRAAGASTANESLAAANALAAAQLAPVRDDYPDDAAASSCTALRSAYARTGIAGAAGTGLSADVTVSACPAASALPATVTVTARVYRTSTPGTTLVSLPTKILVAQP